MTQRNLFDTAPPPWEMDDASEHLLATVVFPEQPRGEYDYLVPDALRGVLQVGCRVRVPLGRGNRTLDGYCVALETRTTSSRALKSVRSVIDRVPLISPQLMAITRWMSEYYLCHWGAVLEGVVPSGVRSQAGTREVIYWHVPTSVAARITQLKLPRKQAEVLKCVAASATPLTSAQIAQQIKCTSTPIHALRDKGLLRAETRREHQSEHEVEQVERGQSLDLNDDQRQALEMIVDALRAPRSDTILVHGVTGSGKTEVYLQAIEEVIRFGRQAIVLVPEISLTPQTVRRFRARFDSVAVLHSHLSPAERHWHWQQIAKGLVQVVVGARSAIFAPTPHLGLIVIDEEHEASFKQDSVPRYHARDVALQRSQREGVPLVLGSATPCLETWYHAQQQRYKLAEMPQRVMDLALPDVVIVDLRYEYKNQFYRGAIGRQLLRAMEESLRDGGQIILLLNRRGFSTHIQCPACGSVVRCPDCAIALTHHRSGEKAVCHYCDYQISTPQRCPECRFDGIRFGGLGTQRLEAEVRARFPEANCLRMDSDTMQKPGSHEEALTRFRNGEVQILLGTQMIAKGLDFPRVTLVGVINADMALHLPDFRAGERTFHLVTQVAGRTGRGHLGGRVYVQTFNPDHLAIQCAKDHDYQRFADAELVSRSQFGYPPFATICRIVARGESESITNSFADGLADRLHDQYQALGVSVRLLGPVPAPIAKLRGKYRFHLLLQGADQSGLTQGLANVSASIKTPAEVQWIIDMDALDMM
ncbi:MAG: primosomal protein N' [Pirellulaceae bacterium]